MVVVRVLPAKVSGHAARCVLYGREVLLDGDAPAKGTDAGWCNVVGHRHPD